MAASTISVTSNEARAEARATAFVATLPEAVETRTTLVFRPATTRRRGQPTRIIEMIAGHTELPRAMAPPSRQRARDVTAPTPEPLVPVGLVVTAMIRAAATPAVTILLAMVLALAGTGPQCQVGPRSRATAGHTSTREAATPAQIRAVVPDLLGTFRCRADGVAMFATAEEAAVNIGLPVVTTGLLAGTTSPPTIGTRPLARARRSTSKGGVSGALHPGKTRAAVAATIIGSMRMTGGLVPAKWFQ